jgi:hypothetical protein
MEATVEQLQLLDLPVLADKARKRSPLWKYVKATAQHGLLGTVAMCASSIGVSRQRMYQLIDAGRVEVVEIDGHKFIPLRKFEQFLLIQRKNGTHAEFHAADSFTDFLDRWEAETKEKFWS